MHGNGVILLPFSKVLFRTADESYEACVAFIFTMQSGFCFDVFCYRSPLPSVIRIIAKCFEISLNESGSRKGVRCSRTERRRSRKRTLKPMTSSFFLCVQYNQS